MTGGSTAAKLEQLEAALTEEVLGLFFVHEHVLRSLSRISPFSLRTAECEETPSPRVGLTRPLVFVRIFEGYRTAMVCPLITNRTAPKCVAPVIPSGMEFFLSFLVTDKEKKKNPQRNRQENCKDISSRLPRRRDAAAENSLHESAKADGEMEGRSDVSCWGCDMNVL